MDINRDELRRQLRAAEREQQASLPAWREALARIFDRNDVSGAIKADILGVPGRRQFLRIGGVTVVGAAVLAACGSDDNGQVPESGDPKSTAGASSTTASTPTTATSEGKKLDLVLSRTATSLELLAVEVYNVALGNSKTKLPKSITFDKSVVDAATLFRDHHQAHADSLKNLTTTLGGEPYQQPNAFVFKNVVAKALPTLTSQDAVLKFAYQLENIAASTYGYAAGVLSTPQLRQGIMGIGGVEARHAAALALALDPNGANAVPRSFLDTSGPARVPDEAIIKS
jgi:Ferritin-like domain